MNTAPIEPAALTFDADGTPYSAEYRDIYHPRAGAFAQAAHVFLGGNALPARWRARERFVVLETGFGLGNNFLATWQAWRGDAQRCAQLCFISIERHPLTRVALARAHRDSPAPELADALLRAWPPLTPNLHRLAFDGDRVQLLLALDDVQAWLPELVASVDAFYLDGYAPDRNPRMWDRRVCKALGRLAAPGATLATWSAARALREHLTSAGFAVRLGAGSGGKRDITLAEYEPAFTPRRAPARIPVRTTAEPHALIVGAGLAGCGAACALAEHGWRSTLFDRHARVAAEASGNPGGLFHGIVGAQDHVHARLHRSAAFAVREAVAIALAHHGVAGGVQGLLRLEAGLDLPRMLSILAAQRLPLDFVQALDAGAASRCAGIDLPHPAWFYPGGGWVEPAGLARSYLERACGAVTLRPNVDIAALERLDAGWRLIDSSGGTIAEAATVILASAGDALRLLGAPDWPIEPVRGQISLGPAARFVLPRVPVAGVGYLLPQLGEVAMFGATAQPGDTDASVRGADHALNLAQLERLIGQRAPIALDELTGRTAWRWTARDRLPLIGAVPDMTAACARLDQPRFVPRQAGLFVFTALGSRGIAWSALGAQVLAALVTGAPVPIEASLLDAIDPARFASRRARQASSGAPSQRRSTV